MILADATALVWEQLAAAGLPCLILAIGIRWLVANNEKRQGEQNSTIKDLVQELRTERAESMAALKEDVKEGKAHMKECDADRHNLRMELIRLAHLAASKLTDKDSDEELPRDPPTSRHIPKPR